VAEILAPGNTAEAGGKHYIAPVLVKKAAVIVNLCCQWQTHLWVQGMALYIETLSHDPITSPA
jgi:hypothetical protein